ncbi:acyl-CoA dehydrogenase family protein [Alicycliphilus sp. T452]|jgi:(2S)-methylsuccinyl-CoA dehydrogenase
MMPAIVSPLLVRTRALFDGAVTALARECAEGGKLDARKLDAQQFASYEIAWAAADLLAAETLAGARLNALDAKLAGVFVAEALGAVLRRLEPLLLDLRLDLQLGELRALAASGELAQFRREAAGAAVQAQAGAAVAAGDGELGDVPLDAGIVMARDGFRRFAAEAVAPLAERIHREDQIVPESLLQPLREMGVFGLSIPEAYGGTAPGSHDDTQMMVAVTEALSEGSLGAAGSLITRPEILARALLAGGTEAQKRRWLPALAVGEPLCAIAMTEPDFGSDVAGLQLKAARAEGGWLLNGAKTWCTFAGKAGVLMVVARTDPDKAAGHRGLSLLLVEKPAFEGHEFAVAQEGGGTLHGRAIPTIGYRGMHSFDLVFENFFVPDENLVGGDAGLGKGFYFTMTGMMGGRMQTAGRALGVMRAAVRAAIRYAGDRQVFGAPLASYQLTQVKIAAMAARFVACRWLAYDVARLLDAGGGRMEASLVKLLACRSAELVTREALQIHGGMGYAEETAVSRYFVDARVLSIFEGAEETLALKVIARSLLEQALEKR